MNDLACVYLNFYRKRSMKYDVVSERLIFLVKFMKKVLEKDPTGSLIKIRSIALNSYEETEDFNQHGMVKEF